MTEKEQTFEGWAILELMGHRRLAGYVTETEIAGAGVLRLDVSSGETEGELFATQFYALSALYCLTPTTEEIARAVAARTRPAPVQRWELPAAPEREEPEYENPDEGFDEGPEGF